MSSICTISTQSHLSKALVVYKSMNRLNPSIQFIIYLVDGDTDDRIIGNLKILDSYKHIPAFGHLRDTKDNMDCTRWSLKPYAIEQTNIINDTDICIFVDNDLYFVNSYDFILNDLETYGIYLTPHWRDNEPHIKNMQFFPLQMDGLFNAGFVGVNRKFGSDFLSWWQRCCQFNCKLQFSLGLYGDQKYLDMALVYYHDILKICDNYGCNLADWNLEYLSRKEHDGELLIRGKDRPVFYHFTSNYTSIIEWADPFSFKYYQQYLKELKNDNIC